MLHEQSLYESGFQGRGTSWRYKSTSHPHLLSWDWTTQGVPVGKEDVQNPGLGSCSVQKCRISGEIREGNWEGAAGEAGKTGRLLRGIQRMCLKQQRVTDYVRCTDESSNMRSENTGSGNVEVTIDPNKGSLNAEVGTEVWWERSRERMEKALTTFQDALPWEAIPQTIPLPALTFRTAERMAIGTSRAGILGSKEERMDAEDFTWLFRPQSALWVLLTTTKADCILKTPHRRLVPEVETLGHCGQMNRTLTQAPNISRDALTLRDVLCTLPPRHWNVFK